MIQTVHPVWSSDFKIFTNTTAVCSISANKVFALRAKKAWTNKMGMAITRPTSVVTNASEIPPESVLALPYPKMVTNWKV